MISPRKHVRTAIATVILATLSTFAVAPVLADGALLRSFQNPTSTSEAIYFPIGVTFDGLNLYISTPSDDTSGIFQISTTGQLIRTISVLEYAGALAWDGTNLWVGTFNVHGQSPSATVYKVSVGSTPAVIGKIELNDIFHADHECGLIDGLVYDTATNTIFVSPDIGCLNSVVPDACAVGYVYQVDLAGNLVNRIVLPYGVGGIAKVGNYLYLNDGGCGHTVHKTTLDGTQVSTFSLIMSSSTGHDPEGSAFDPSTFAPNCALWFQQRIFLNGALTSFITAYQVDCP